jgi:hypothetical protein
MAQSHHIQAQNLLQELIETTNRPAFEVLTKDCLEDVIAESHSVLPITSIRLLRQLLRHNLKNAIHWIDRR